jgi:hypothetical protein
MSSTAAADIGSPGSARSPGTPRSGLAGPQPRVRHQARESLVLMVFSAAASTAFAGCLLVLTALGHQG